MIDERDQELFGRYAALKREVEHVAPPFTVPQARQVRRTAPAWWAVAAGVSGLLLWQATVSGSPSVSSPAVINIDPAATSWVAPTDFLLDTPGSQYLRTIPTLRLVSPSAERSEP